LPFRLESDTIAGVVLFAYCHALILMRIKHHATALPSWEKGGKTVLLFVHLLAGIDVVVQHRNCLTLSGKLRKRRSCLVQAPPQCFFE
jgi:hypothetical protein